MGISPTYQGKWLDYWGYVPQIDRKCKNEWEVGNFSEKYPSEPQTFRSQPRCDISLCKKGLFKAIHGMFPDLGIIIKKLIAGYATEGGGGETHRKQIKQNRLTGIAEAHL